MILLYEYSNDSESRHAFIYKNYSSYIVKMNENYVNKFVSEFDNLEEAELCSMEWTNE